MQEEGILKLMDLFIISKAAAGCIIGAIVISGLISHTELKGTFKLLVCILCFMAGYFYSKDSITQSTEATTLKLEKFEKFETLESELVQLRNQISDNEQTISALRNEKIKADKQISDYQDKLTEKNKAIIDLTKLVNEQREFIRKAR